MPTLQVAIDARKAKQGADEYSKASKKVKTAATQAEKSTRGLSKGLDKLGTSGIGAKKVLAGVFTGLAALAKTPLDPLGSSVPLPLFHGLGAESFANSIYTLSPPVPDVHDISI